MLSYTSHLYHRITTTVDFSYPWEKLFNNFLNNYSEYTSSSISSNTQILESFGSRFNNVNFDLYHYTTPNVKLYYPEPFIASPTFVHEDIWFLHIVIYQYWLWFFFMYIIIFFFLTFLVTIRNCSLRNRPMRETRGVSRSKCGDLITATVPVSWAASIIIHESTDAVEIMDGFGTTEMAVGIRAYQWGWEYYYPKDNDFLLLNKNNSYNLGASLKYQLNSGDSTYKHAFRKNLLKSDTNRLSKNSLIYPLKSFNLVSLNYDSFFINFGINKLSTKTVTNLVSTNKLLNFNHLYTSWYADNYSIYEKLNLLKKYYFDLNVSSRPISNYVNSSFTTSFHLFNPFYTYLNYLDLLSIYSKKTTPSHFINNFTFFFNNSFCKNKLDVVADLYDTKNIEKNLSFYSKNSSGIFLNMNLNIYSFFETTKSLNLIYSLLANKDFKRWASLELFENIYYNSVCDNDLITWHNDNNTSKSFFKDLTLSDPIQNPFVIGNNLYFLSLLNNSIILSSMNITWSQDLIFNSSLNLLSMSSLFKSFNINVWFNYFFNFRFISIYELLRSYTSANNFNLVSNNFFVANNSNRDQLLSEDTYNFINSFKNLNIFNQAFSKIFKSTVEEERSGLAFNVYSKYLQPQIFISEKPTPLYNNLNKNINYHFQPIVFKYNTQWDNSHLISLSKLTNYFSINFPFSLSTESDIIRYTWWDWYTTRSLISTKALDTSAFGLHGTKYYTFQFTNNKFLSNINQLDNYLNKYIFARKLLIPFNSYSPFYFLRHLERHTFSFSMYDKKTTLSNSLTILNLLTFVTSGFFNLDRNTYASPNLSPTFAFSNIHNYTNFDNSSTTTINSWSFLSDILTKREFLYLKLVNSPANVLLDSNLDVLTDFKDLNSKPNLSIKKTTSLLNSNLVPQSQYQTMRKGVNNMIRIQADKAIAMPVETRLQILAVSKDIIHSWSIPSAGVKIDCIPGYSSHRVVIFLVSGIYWGQCMEICGRFHHWMPIVVYFMKRDLFCLWCIHFIFKNKTNTGLSQNYINQFQTSNNLSHNAWTSWNMNF